MYKIGKLDRVQIVSHVCNRHNIKRAFKGSYHRAVSRYLYTGSEVFLTPKMSSCLHNISITENKY